MITRLALKNFTAFSELDLSFSSGINILIGDNGTGKTHVLKVLYAGLSGIRDKNLPERLTSVFLPSDKNVGGLIRRGGSQNTAQVDIYNGGKVFPFSIRKLNSRLSALHLSLGDVDQEVTESDSSVYIPVKEILSNAPGFNSLYREREIYFEEVYSDIVFKAMLPRKREITSPYKDICAKLENVMGGDVYSKNDQFYLHGNDFDLEFPLFSEGMRKLGLLWLLIQNGSLEKGTVLFWDEPDANMNPSLVKVVVETLLELQRQGVQIFVATHNYIVLKEFDLQKRQDDPVRFFSFVKEGRDINVQCGDEYLDIVPNKITEAYSEVYEKEVRRSIGGE